MNGATNCLCTCSLPALLGDAGLSGMGKDVMMFLLKASSTVTGMTLSVTGFAICHLFDILTGRKLSSVPANGLSLTL